MESQNKARATIAAIGKAEAMEEGVTTVGSLGY
jgi:hypothetical protein